MNAQDEKKLLASLLSYRGQRPELLTLAHALRLGLGKSTPEDAAHFQAVASAQGETRGQAMRESVQRLALDTEKLMMPRSDDMPQAVAPLTKVAQHRHKRANTCKKEGSA